MPLSRPFAVTPGEPAGIGPDLCLLLARAAQPQVLVAIASRAAAGANAPRSSAWPSHCSRSIPAAWPTDAGTRRQPVRLGHPAGGAGATPASSIRRNAGYVLETLLRRRQRLPRRRLRRDDHRAGAQGRDQRGRHPLLRTHRIPRRADPHRAGGDDARHRRPARGAGDHPPAATRGGRRHHRRASGTGDAHPAQRSARQVRHRPAAHPGLRPQPARRRRRPPGPRGNRHHRADPGRTCAAKAST